MSDIQSYLNARFTAGPTPAFKPVGPGHEDGGDMTYPYCTRTVRIPPSARRVVETSKRVTESRSHDDDRQFCITMTDVQFLPRDAYA